jgi:hypothetical protein
LEPPALSRPLPLPQIPLAAKVSAVAPAEKNGIKLKNKTINFEMSSCQKFSKISALVYCTIQMY